MRDMRGDESLNPPRDMSGTRGGVGSNRMSINPEFNKFLYNEIDATLNLVARARDLAPKADDPNTREVMRDTLKEAKKSIAKNIKLL